MNDIYIDSVTVEGIKEERKGGKKRGREGNKGESKEGNSKFSILHIKFFNRIFIGKCPTDPQGRRLSLYSSVFLLNTLFYQTFRNNSITRGFILNCILS